MSNEANGTTPSRKIHSSQELERAAKVAGFGRAVKTGKNHFDLLTQAESYPDKTMRPGFICSNSTKASYAKMAGQSAMSQGSANQTANQTTQPINTFDASESLAVVREPLEVEGIFCIKNHCALREEIEVQFLSLNN